MIRPFRFVALIASLFLAGADRSAQAFDPGFQFAFGYSLGQSYQFRNRLPAPPYFSVYPPVYYGQRYERPYGESPFASWPLLQANSDYQVRPKQTPVPMVNPYVTPCPHCEQTITHAEPTAEGKMVTVENPFVHQGTSVASVTGNE